ncbi:hypothetical protein NQ317_005760 [Molorchus minor]|uniref:Trans-1,2-dihydrobenzene-1,2-diol dehydrogenase n=1 Tax=Molorchus minor TaxID=1323400 RepID=A0ABQ9JVF0_9CUCU|nr:hypothetical protein NQ317_005760 [Molorchus minor]
MALRWGVAGAGRISHDFVGSLTAYSETEHKVVAVAAGSKERARKFAEDHAIERYYERYLDLAQDENVDIVYVGNLNTQHFDTSKLMLEQGKHVLCEKPFTMNEKQVKRLVQVARENKLFLMEAVWSRCFPAYKEMKRLIDTGAIGDVLFASVHFGHAIQHVDRLTSKEMGGGAILDLGIYILQFQQYIFRGLRPIKIAVNGHLNKCGTDESCGVVITYPEGKMAVVSTSARVSLPNEGVVVGTNGTLRLPDFWCPDKLITPSGVLNFPLPKTKATYLHHNSAGLCYEADEAKQCIKQGKIESSHITHEESIELARLMDHLRFEMGVKFPEDSQEF